ncbi:MAG: hypothetical protein Q8M86_01895 [Syntrophales bacterium]|nr:hypothetical protein [Syntrophales bacterium]MDP3096681.1 hypothetical protein [Syntrophales bacterium]
MIAGEIRIGLSPKSSFSANVESVMCGEDKKPDFCGFCLDCLVGLADDKKK